MKLRTTLALLPLALLAACGGDKQAVNKPTTPGQTIFSYPADGQQGVSPKADIVLRFSHAITDDEATAKTKINLTNDQGAVDYELTPVDGGRSLKLTPTKPLAVNSRYSVEITEGLAAEGGRIITNPNSIHDSEPGIQFDTRGSHSGVAGLANASESFVLTDMVPQMGSQFQPMNFSTFRLKLSHPVHPQWQAKGGSIQLLDKGDTPVPSTVLVKGNRITVDPCVTEDPQQCGSKQDVLNAGETYKLVISDLPSLTAQGETFSATYEFTPRNTGPTVVLQQSAVDSGLARTGSADGAIESVLNGQIINGVTLNSVLQGVAGPSQQTGNMFAELGYAPGFSNNEALPLRIPKGSVLTSTSLDVLVGGKVPVLDAATGELQTTGDIKVTMLSDASGYLSPNPYTDDINAPRQITLFMDVSMNATEAQPNAALSQDLLGVELRGIALVQNGVLTIDAIGMVEPGLLGQEFTDSTIAFHLQAATDVNSQLDAEFLRELDVTPPRLVSWMPGHKENAIPKTRQSMQRPGDPVILFFDEPLDPDSIADGITMYADGLQVDTLNTSLDGTSLTLNPEGGLKQGVDYEVTVNGLTDLAGNAAAVAPLNFKLDPTENGATPKAPPLALTTYPGFPCESTEDQVDLRAGTHGQCWDRRPGGESPNGNEGGDLLPLSGMPEDRPIVVVFSQPMNLDTIRLGETFIVEKVDADKKRIKTETDDGFISGRLEKNTQRIRFYPDQPWDQKSFYRYTMKSVRGPSDTCPAGEAASTSKSICGVNSLPLKADLLEGLIGEKDGDNSMVIYFKGVAAQDSVFTPLRNLPVRDTNANFSVDCSSNDKNEDCLEPFAHEYLDPAEVDSSDIVSGWLPSANTTKLHVRNNEATANRGTGSIVKREVPARVGCSTKGEDCPKSKFIYQTYALNTEVKGKGIYEPTGEEGILVDLYPTALATTSIDVFTELRLLGFIPLEEVSTTNTQVIRMRYAKDDPDCNGPACERTKLIPGAIIEGENGQPVFKTIAELTLDAPDMVIPLGGTHDVYSTEFVFELEGDVTFFDDGRMQVEQRNTSLVDIEVVAKTAGIKGGELVTIYLPLQIPIGGTYLNFISNPVKDLPAVQ